MEIGKKSIRSYVAQLDATLAGIERKNLMAKRWIGGYQHFVSSLLRDIKLASRSDDRSPAENQPIKNDLVSLKSVYSEIVAGELVSTTNAYNKKSPLNWPFYNSYHIIGSLVELIDPILTGDRHYQNVMRANFQVLNIEAENVRRVKLELEDRIKQLCTESQLPEEMRDFAPRFNISRSPVLFSKP